MGEYSTNDDPSPNDVIPRIVRGETTAFEGIVRRFERPLRSWLATQAPPALDVDELAQRTFVVAFAKLREFEPDSDFAAWLFTIARFELKTELTRLRRVADYHARFAPDLLQRELDRRSSEPPELQQQRLDHLAECLRSFGEHTRRYITWRYEEEIPLEEMATRSGRSVSAVKKQLWQLRRRLHECIEARMAAEEGNVMNNDERFEQLWNDYLEGELHEDGIAELQQLLASNDTFLRAAADSFQVHRLLGLKVEDSETRHEDFVRATMGQLPSSETELVGEVMKMLPVRRAGKPYTHLLFRGFVAAALLLVVALLFFRASASPEVARITGLHGAVQWTGEGGVVQDLDRVGEVLRGGTLESPSADTWAELTYRDGTTVTVSGRSLLTLSEQRQKIVRLRYGNLSANVTPQPTGRPMLVLTPTAELNVLGTQFNVDAQSESTRLVVNEGRVRLRRNDADGKEVDVEAQQSITTSINYQDGLVPVQRADSISAWKSDLKADVVYGKWVSRLWSLGAKLKLAIANGEMTKDDAIKAYKRSAHFDDFYRKRLVGTFASWFTHGSLTAKVCATARSIERKHSDCCPWTSAQASCG